MCQHTCSGNLHQDPQLLHKNTLLPPQDIPILFSQESAQDIHSRHTTAIVRQQRYSINVCIHWCLESQPRLNFHCRQHSAPFSLATHGLGIVTSCLVHSPVPVHLRRICSNLYHSLYSTLSPPAISYQSISQPLQRPTKQSARSKKILAREKASEELSPQQSL